MKLQVKNCIAELANIYRESLEDDGDFVASEMNQQCGGDYWRFNADTDEIVVNFEELNRADHYRVEYDLSFDGTGDYTGQGRFAYIPVPYVVWFGSVELAFETLMGLNSNCIVHYSGDDMYDSNGNLKHE